MQEKICLYSPQSENVWKAVKDNGTAYSRRQYVQKKYGETAPVFMAAYDFFVRELPAFVKKPDGAEYPYWAFTDPGQLDPSGGGRVMHLEVPVEEAVFFDAFDWYKILNLSYLGEKEQEEEMFAKELVRRGIRNSSDVILTPFFPDLKKKLTASWKTLFRHHNEICQGNTEGVRVVQAGLWCIRQEWLKE